MTETPKTSIGGYAISRRLPGPGESYQARSPSGDRVLLRVLPRPTADEAWDQLKQDVAVSRRLEHPAIAKPSDVFEDGPTLVLAHEYFEGSKLSQLMKRPMSRTKLQGPGAWYIAHQLVGALAQAHTAMDDQGIPAALCHGHVGPGSVLVSVTGEVRVEGLGLAALSGTEEAPAAAGYQAPEEARSGRVTPRGDLYSAAMLLWAMLTGGDPQSLQGQPDLSALERAVPPQVLSALKLALEPKVASRKITGMEVEQALAEAYDRQEGQDAAGAAARALAQSGRTLAGTGGMLMGLVGGGPPAKDGGGAAAPKPAVRPTAEAASGGGPVGGSAVLGPGMRRPAPPPEDTAPAMPFAEPVAVPAAADGAGQPASSVARARVGGPKRKLRQPTLLGSWLKKPADPSEPDQGPAAKPADAASPGAAGGGKPAATAAAPGLRRAAVDPHAGARPTAPAAAPTKRADTVEPDDSLDLEAAMLGATVTAAAHPQPADQRASEAAEGLASDHQADRETATKPAAAALPDQTGPTTAAEAKGIESGLSDVATVPLPPKATGPETVDMPVGPSAAPALAPSEPVAKRVGGSEPRVVAPDAAPAQDGPTAVTGVPAVETPEPDAAASDAASPWSPPSAATGHGGAPGKPLSWTGAIAIALVTAVLTAAVGIWWTRRQVGLVEVPPPATAETSAASGSATTSAGPAASASAASPVATASATATAEATATPAGPDGSNLPADRGLLQVSFSPVEGAEVFLYGKSFGAVGEPLEVPCGSRFVRVGKMPGPAWLSEGQSVDIACQSVTTVTLDPK